MPSGVVGLVHLSNVSVALFAFGAFYGHERPSPHHAIAVLLGVIGLAVLFVPRLVEEQASVLWGVGAIVASAISYGWGSVRGRPLLRNNDPGLVNAFAALAGGSALLIISAVTERGSGAELQAFLAPPVVISWLFLVVFGSILGLTIYLRLLRDWGAARTGMYAFPSSVIALWVGWACFEEPLSVIELGSTALLLAATGLSIRGGAGPHRGG